MENKLIDKIIIRNYTEYDDASILKYILKVVEQGKISKTKSEGRQYCFATTFEKVTVTCKKIGDTYTFYIF